MTHYVGVGDCSGYGDDGSASCSAGVAGAVTIPGDDATAVTAPGATVTIAAPGDGDGLGGYVHIYY